MTSKIFTENERLIVECLCSQLFGTVKEPKGGLRHPFIEPGTGYSGSLWDWDSFWMAEAMESLVFLCSRLGEDVCQKQAAFTRGVKGCVLNFLEHQDEDGYVPIVIHTEGNCVSLDDRRNFKNTHKPFLCRQALLAARASGSADWLDTERLCRFVDYYRKNFFDQESGLYFWGDDVMIGVDNNPTVFGRPENSSADIFLNSFMAEELDALVSLLKMRGEPYDRYAAMRDELKASVRREMWDEVTGCFYSQDLLSKTRKTQYFHHGLGVFWKAMPLKIKFWGCFLPLTCGIADEGQAERVVANFSTPDINAPYGVRTISDKEKMYRLGFSNNPSNWLGAVWTIANYSVFTGLMNYGYKKSAAELYEKTINLLSNDIKRTGSMSESYHPDTGEPFGFNGFISFNALAACMIRRMKEDE